MAQGYKTYEVRVYPNGDKHWYYNNLLHREDRPAIEHVDVGYKAWYKNGKKHRIDGPAEEYANGYKSWYQNGEHHREDGPAVEHSDGTKQWYINGKSLTEADFNVRNQTCNGRVVEIDGKKYKLTLVE
jgi:antitoxin component YwqK of YwqJK toxin-antitoxin module